MSKEVIESISDERTVNNTMRHQYRVLSESEKVEVQTIKDKALDLHAYLDTLEPSRENSLAKTKLEEVVFWAVKSITK